MNMEGQKIVTEAMTSLHERMKTGCLCFDEGKCLPGETFLSAISQKSTFSSDDCECLLMDCSLLEEMCYLYTIQHRSGHVCSALVRLIKQVQNECVYDHLGTLLTSGDQYISFVAMKALLGLIKADCLSSGSLHKLEKQCQKLAASFLPLDKTFVNKIFFFEHLLIEFKHFSKRLPMPRNPIDCHLTAVGCVEIETFNMSLICNILHSIISLPDLIKNILQWPADSKIHSLNCILRALLTIFESTNKIKLAFLQDASSLIDLLTGEMPPLTWERTCSVLRNILDYKSTASTTTNESKFKLACEILNLGNSRLWTRIPHSVGFHGFGGPFNLDESDPSRDLSSHADKPVLQSFLLCNLASLATISKTEGPVHHIHAKVLKNGMVSIRECIRLKVCPCLDSRNGTLNETLGSLLLFDDQDDALIEALLYFLEISSYSDGVDSLKNSADNANNSQFWNPHHHFFIFLLIVNMDYEVLLDLLISEETCFLLYFLKYLKLIVSNYDSFTFSHKTGQMNAYLGTTFASTYLKNGRALDGKTEKLVDYDMSSEESEEETCHVSNTYMKYSPHPSEAGAKSPIGSVPEIGSTVKNTLLEVIHVFSLLLVTIKKQLDKNLFPYNAKPLVKLLENIKMNYK